MASKHLLVLMLVALALPGLGAAQEGDWQTFTLGVKAKGLWHDMSSEQLRSLADGKESSLRGSKMRDVIPMSNLLDHLEIPLDDVAWVLFVSDKRSMLIENDLLEHLPALSIKLGTLRAAIRTDDDATWKALQPEFGGPRFKNLESIYVWTKNKRANVDREDG